MHPLSNVRLRVILKRGESDLTNEEVVALVRELLHARHTRNAIMTWLDMWPDVDEAQR